MAPLLSPGGRGLVTAKCCAIGDAPRFPLIVCLGGTQSLGPLPSLGAWASLVEAAVMGSHHLEESLGRCGLLGSVPVVPVPFPGASAVRWAF